MPLQYWSYADPFMCQGKLHFAIWNDGAMSTVAYAPNRLIAAVAKEEGVFTTPPFAWPDKGMALGADARDGWIEAELLDVSGKAVAHVRIEKTKGETLPLLLPKPASDTVRIRFRMHAARIFALVAQ